MSQCSMILIGMPGAGKSTLGRALAEQLQRPFLDTDALIEQTRGESLQSIADKLGYVGFRRLEGKLVSQCELPNPAVIATGGSVVYSQNAMARLAGEGVCVYLSITMATLTARVGDLGQRGFSHAPGQTLTQVFNERQKLYTQYADRKLVCDDLSEQQALAALLEWVDLPLNRPARGR